MTEEQVFLAALDLPDDAARAAYLDEACGDDTGLRRKVDGLLASHFKSGEFLDVPAAEQVDIGTDADFPVTIQSDAMPADKFPEDEDEGLSFLSPPTRPDSLGRIGHYEVLQVLGKGGFGIVFRAFDDILQRVVAIKVMAPQLAATSPARKRFLREARTSAAVRHENVVQVYEVGEQPLPHLAMEFIPGETLQQRLDRVGPLDVQETLRIGRQIAEGLGAAHANDLIHRDIKPGNVLLEGAQHKVKITDFGLARAADDASMTQSGMIAGTPMYMAPEQALGHTLDHRVDLFSLGSVMYQMVSGRPPFRANTTVAVLKRVAEDTPRNIREVIPETPQWLCDIIAKLHAKDPKDRFQSAREVADVLADCETQLKANSKLQNYSRIPRVETEPSKPSFRPPRWAAFLVGRPALGTLISLLILVAVFIPVYYYQPGALAAAGIMSVTFLLMLWVLGIALMSPASAEPTLLKPHWGPSRKWFAAAAVLLSALVLGVFAMPSLYNYATNEGTLIYAGAIDPNLENILIKRDGEVVAKLLTSHGIVHLPAGDYEAEVICKEGYELARYRRGPFSVFSDAPGALGWEDAVGRTIPLTLTRDWDVGISLKLAELSADPKEESGWVQLFNGKNFTGWKQDGYWTVEDGMLVSRIPESPAKQPGFLTTTRSDFRDFHLRVEGKINAPGDSGLFFRFGEQGDASLQAQIVPSPNHAGSILRNADTLVPARLSIKSDKWFTMEVIAQGPLVEVLVDGKAASQWSYPSGQIPSGPIALESGFPKTEFMVRKVEVMRLGASRPAEPGWVQLFNGRDLSGWKKHPKYPGFWRVDENGHLFGAGPVDYAFLSTVRDDFQDFHLRVEAMVDTPDSDSGVFVRVPSLEEGCGFAEVNISSDPAQPGQQTGSILVETNGKRSWYPAANGLIKAKEWFILEIIARGDRVVTKVNGKLALDTQVPAANRRGHIFLQQCEGKTTVRFKRIEIKELPHEEPNWVQLFNGKDLTGWKTHPDQPGNWKVESGNLVGSGAPAPLFTERGDFKDVHFRVEAMYLGGMDSGQFVRTSFAAEPHDGYEAQIGQNTATLFRYGTGGFVLHQTNDPIPPNTWFVQEFIAKGNQLTVKLNGQTIAQNTDDHYTSGHLALHNFKQQGTVLFRKIEIKELLPQEPPLAIAPFDATQAKQHQDGWAKHLGMPVEYTNSIGMRFRIIPPGEFLMGSADDDPDAQPNEKPQHKVRLTRPMWVGMHEVTVGEFRKFVEATGYKSEAESSGQGGTYWDAAQRKTIGSPDVNWAKLPFEQGDDSPVCCVTWNDARKFCEWLSQKDGRTYSLPTEAQWEFACRAGTTTRMPYGDLYGPTKANFANPSHRPEAVGSYPANGFGLYDMIGNVHEWCQDDTRTYEPGPAIDPTGPVADTPTRAVRGGGYASHVSLSRSASRYTEPANCSYATWGFRVMTLDIAPVKKELLPRTVTNTLGMEFVLVPKGKSWLGGRKDKLGDQEVEIPAAFYLGKYEVTQEEWEKVMGSNPSFFAAVVGVRPEDQKRMPLDSVSWENAQDFLKLLNESAKEPGWVYRLPTQTEWEYACRGGPLPDKSKSAFNFYFDEPTNALTSELANYADTGLQRTCPVGLYKPNALGLYDMHGNVWEWCQDEVKDGNGESQRAIRGGGWFNPSKSAWAAGRNSSTPSRMAKDIGLRLARVPSGAPSSETKSPPPTVSGKLFLNDPAFPQWLADVQAMTAEKQVEAVSKKLMELNPGFDGKVGGLYRSPKPHIENGAVTQLWIQTDHVTDISPLRAFADAQLIDLAGGPNSTLSDLSPLQGLKLTGLNIGGTQVTDLTPLSEMPLTFLHGDGIPASDLTPLQRLKLEDLHISGTKVAELSPLKEMPLKRLMIRDSEVTDLTPLQGMSLEGIWLTPKNITKGLEVLREMQNLKSIGIDQAWPAAEFWERYDKGEFWQAMPPDRRAAKYVLSIGGTVRGHGLVRQIKAAVDLPPENFRLTMVLLADNKQITDEGLANFKDCQNLTDLQLHGTPVSDAGLAHFKDCKELKNLNLGYTQVGDAGLAHFKDCKSLTHLHLESTQVSDEGLAQCEHCKDLTYLSLPDTQVSDAGLVHLKDCKNLTSLALQETKVTAAGIDELKKALPKSKIQWDGGVIEPK